MKPAAPSVFALPCLALAFGLGCATRPAPVTKLVGGQVVVTRSIAPAAYEHAARALVFEEEGRWVEAAAELQRALIFDQDASELHARLAEVFLKLDRIEDATEAVQASLAIEPTLVGHMAQAHLRQRQGDARGALEALRRAVALADLNADATTAEYAHLELADGALMALAPKEARQALESFCDAAPRSGQARVRLAAVAWSLGDTTAAADRLNEAIAIDPNHLEARLTLAWLHASEGRVGPAKKAFEESLERSEGDPEIRAAFARFLVTAGDAKGAAELADDVDTAADDVEAMLARIEVESAAGRKLRAFELAERARQEAHTDEMKDKVDLARAEALVELGRRDEAHRIWLSVPKRSASYLEARLRAAASLREQGKLDDAERLLEALAVEGEPRAEVTIAQATLDERRGDPARGARRLESALAKDPHDVRLTLALAALEDRRGQWRQALELAERVLKKHPGSVEALNFWGFVAADHAHALPQAERRLIAAAAMEPGHASILDSLGWVHLRKGDLRAAALFLEQAGRLEPDDPEVLGHLGDLYARRVENDRALDAFRRALTLKPEEMLRRHIEEQLTRIEARKAAGR